MITIEVKNKEFNGERCGVGFVNGVAKVESLTPEQKAAFKKFGYTVNGAAEKKTNANNAAANNTNGAGNKAEN